MGFGKLDLGVQGGQKLTKVTGQLQIHSSCGGGTGRMGGRGGGGRQSWGQRIWTGVVGRGGVVRSSGIHHAIVVVFSFISISK